MKKQRGFTLIELMVIIAVVIIVVAAIIASLNKARAQARDARRLNDMHEVVLALEAYYEKYRRYPASDNAGCGSWDTPGNGTFIQALRTEGFLPRDIKDPTGDSNCGNYRYYRYPPGYNSCAQAGFYVLQIVSFETVQGQHPESPGWACGSSAVSWNTVWVTGRYE